MPLTDRDRLAGDRLHPGVVDLWFALQALGSVASFMQSGAHPDDETSAMLAVLRFRDGLSTSYVCATRGEGGQNDIGHETRRDLGTIRTAEMERAAEALDMRLWWLSEGPQDPIFDFGFSKSGVETLGVWGRDRLLARFVDLVRRERPDILCPTFLDVGGQHGHHRAMTEAARLVFDAAADPAFSGSTLPVWSVSKLYLPAWGGGGGSYDDEEAPPAATVTVPGRGRDPVTGWSWENIAQASRAFHRTQGMGRWMPHGSERDWPLHLLETRVGPDHGRVTDNLALTLADLGLAAAQEAVAAARAAFPDGTAVAAKAAEALTHLDAARVPPEHAHRLERKRRELVRALRLAAGIRVRARVASDWLAPRAATELTIESDPGAAAVGIAPVLPAGWVADGARLSVGDDVAPSFPYPVAYDPLVPALPALSLHLTVAGRAADCLLPFEVPPQVGPAAAVRLTPEAALLNLALPRPALSARISDIRPAGATPGLNLPDGWRQTWADGVAQIVPPVGVGPGLVEAPLTLDGEAALTERRFAYGHIAPRLRAAPAGLRIRMAHVALPDVRVGYVGAGNDNVLHWLRAMGLDTTVPTPAALADGTAFDGIGALVVGVFGFRNPGLAAALPRLHRWVENGGTLVTLYHRPGDNWQPDATPPRRIEIGSPSLRWRVTDETAPVTHLDPEHPVLTSPNPIGAEDWAGWKKERGLYFARRWDAAYQPLVQMADPGEAPHRGALLSAEIGRGRHSHVALNLHHQLPELVTGAFRLMANLVSPR